MFQKKYPEHTSSLPEINFLNLNLDSDGHVYEGDWVNDLRQGHGIMKFVDGTIYGVSLRTVNVASSICLLPSD